MEIWALSADNVYNKIIIQAFALQMQQFLKWGSLKRRLIWNEFVVPTCIVSLQNEA